MAPFAEGEAYRRICRSKSWTNTLLGSAPVALANANCIRVNRASVAYLPVGIFGTPK